MINFSHNQKFYMKMLRYACVLTLLFYSSNAVLDRNGDEDDAAVDHSSHDASHNTWAATEVDDELDNLNADVFPGIHSDCLYFAVESIEFDLSDNRSFNSSWLMEEYNDHNFTVIGCNSNKTIHSLFQCGNHSNGELFTFNATFRMQKRTNECSEDTWSMVELSHTNLTDSHHYVYEIDQVTAESDCCYHCGSISFTSKYGDAKITLKNITIQAFSLDGTKLSSKVVTCRKTYNYDYLTYVISSGMGVSVILAIIVIITSCLTKRLKYGKYNLLDT